MVWIQTAKESQSTTSKANSNAKIKEWYIEFTNRIEAFK
jgi:hypothetical protein